MLPDSSGSRLWSHPPALKYFWLKAPDIVQQRQAVSTALLLNSWPIEPVNVMDVYLWLNFRAVYYAVVVTGICPSPPFWSVKVLFILKSPAQSPLLWSPSLPPAPGAESMPGSDCRTICNFYLQSALPVPPPRPAPGGHWVRKVALLIVRTQKLFTKRISFFIFIWNSNSMQPPFKICKEGNLILGCKQGLPRNECPALKNSRVTQLGLPLKVNLQHK